MREKRNIEINRAEAVARYKEKQLLQKIAALEELDQGDQLSDRRMLAEAYREYGKFLSNADPTRTLEMHFRAFRVLLEMFEDGHLEEKDLEMLSFPIWSINEIAFLQGAKGDYERTKQYLGLLEKRLKELEEEVEAAQNIKEPEGREAYDLYNAIFERRPRKTELPAESPESEADEYVVPLCVDGQERRVVEKFEVPTCRVLRFEDGIEMVKGVKSNSRFQKLILPPSVKEIGSYAFARVKNLEEAFIPSGIIGVSAFENCEKLKCISLGDDVLLKGNPFQECGELKDIIISPNNRAYKMMNNVLVEKDAVRIVCAPLMRMIGEYTVDADIQEIGDQAFCCAKRLTGLEFKNRLRKVGFHAFEGCENLTRIRGLDVSGEIGSGAFEKCRSLKSIELRADVLELHAFSECIALKDAVIDVRKLGRSIFNWCVSLTNLYLGDRLREMGAELFHECSALRLIRIPGELKEYPQIPYQRQSPITLQVHRGSMAEVYAKAYNYPYVYEGEETIHRTSDEISEEDRKALLTRNFHDICLYPAFADILARARIKTPADALRYSRRELEAKLENPEATGADMVEELGNILDTLGLSIRETNYDLGRIIKEGWKLYEEYMGAH